MANGVFLVHPGLRFFGVAKLCRTKNPMTCFSHSVATMQFFYPRVQLGNPWVIEFFFRKTWICHDLSIWIQTYLEATTKQWYLYDHGNRGYHYRKIYWNLGLQKKKSGNQRLHWTMNVSIASFHLFAWCWNQKIRSSHHKSQFDDYFFHIFLFPQHFLRDICAELRWFVPQFPSGNKSPMKKIGGFPS